LALIGEGEGRGLEFKSGLPRDEKIARTLGAFANTSGGLLLIGVRDRGEVCGVSDAAGVEERLRSVALVEVEPPVEVELRRVRVGGACVVICEVPLSADRPHAQCFDGRVMVRVGASNRAAEGATLVALRAHVSRRKPRGEFERRILDWVEERGGCADDPGGDASSDEFARVMNVGRQRARRAFLKLERDGVLVAHGVGRARWYRRR
jgi:predicted HTH transcriptional regulator